MPGVVHPLTITKQAMVNPSSAFGKTTLHSKTFRFDTFDAAEILLVGEAIPHAELGTGLYEAVFLWRGNVLQAKTAAPPAVAAPPSDRLPAS